MAPGFAQILSAPNFVGVEQSLGLASGVLGAISYGPYLYDIARGQTRPERVTWFIWGVLGVIAFGSQISEGATHSLWPTAVQCLAIVVVLALAIPKGVGGFTRRDVAALLFAAAGLALWALTHNALLSLLIIVSVDFAGALLTLGKAYRDPSSETLCTWAMSAVAWLCASAAVGRLDFSLLVYPIYLAAVNIAVCVAMLAGRRHLSIADSYDEDDAMIIDIRDSVVLPQLLTMDVFTEQQIPQRTVVGSR